MIHAKPLLLCSLICISPGLSASHFLTTFDDMHKDMLEFMDKMNKEMDSMRQSMETAVKDVFGNTDESNKSKIGFTLDQDDEQNVKLTLTGISADTIDASFDNKTLTVTFPDTKAILRVGRNNILSLSMIQEAKRESKNEKGEISNTSYAVSQSNYRESLHKLVDLENTKIDYSKSDQTLTLIIPTIQTKKSIPINVK